MDTTLTNLPLPSYPPTCTYPSLTLCSQCTNAEKKIEIWQGDFFECSRFTDHHNTLHALILIQNVFSLSFQLINHARTPLVPFAMHSDSMGVFDAVWDRGGLGSAVTVKDRQR